MYGPLFHTQNPLSRKVPAQWILCIKKCGHYRATATNLKTNPDCNTDSQLSKFDVMEWGVMRSASPLGCCDCVRVVES